MSRAAVEQYTGEGEPPYCEMTVRAEGMKELLGDLHFAATLKGVKTSPIILNRPYESFYCQNLYSAQVSTIIYVPLAFFLWLWLLLLSQISQI